MPVQIGARPHSFANPTALLSDCHRRIEMFLASLQRVAEIIPEPLSGDARAALEAALRYFREAAPRHTADEEESLFPRLRNLRNCATEGAIAALDALEDEHERADTLHAEVNALGVRYLDQGSLSASEAARFRQAVFELAQIYEKHIRVEDEVVFPAANGALSGTEKAAIAGEMASRRGLAT